MDEIKKEYINDNGENYEIIKEEKKEYINDNGESVVEHKIYLLKIDNKWKGQKTYYDKNKEILKKNKILKPDNIIDIINLKYPEIWEIYKIDVKNNY
jgi:hypothetical protein